MQLKQLFDDDDAVSPVIGVILMVAITVILAAVIATFVLGLGEQVSSTTPTASFSTEYSEVNNDEGNLTITHDGGDTIKAEEVYIRGQNGSNGGNAVSNYNDPWVNFTTQVQANQARAGNDNPVYGSTFNSQNVSVGTNSSDISGESAVASGDFLRFPVGSDAELSVIFDGGEGNTGTLASFSGPDA
jgi:flagellin-like protein